MLVPLKHHRHFQALIPSPSSQNPHPVWCPQLPSASRLAAAGSEERGAKVSPGWVVGKGKTRRTISLRNIRWNKLLQRTDKKKMREKRITFERQIGIFK